MALIKKFEGTDCLGVPGVVQRGGGTSATYQRYTTTASSKRVSSRERATALNDVWASVESKAKVAGRQGITP